jgi:serine/arginine repetitive matrix protein 1
MSHARQPFSRSGIVSGVKVKKSTVKYPPELNRRVNLGNVKWEVMKPWIARRVTELLTVEDDVLISMIYNLLEQEQVHKNGGEIYAQLQTFLEQHTATFMKV